MTGIAEVLLVLGTLDTAGCRVWVGGGWGVDVLVGRQTREHHDLDLAIDAAGLHHGRAALSELGYLVETDWLPVRLELHRPGHGRVDLHPVTFDESGHGTQPGLAGAVFRYPAGSFLRRRFHGAVIGCLSPGLQLQFRQGYELRAADRHDLTLLQTMTCRAGQG